MATRARRSTVPSMSRNSCVAFSSMSYPRALSKFVITGYSVLAVASAYTRPDNCLSPQQTWHPLCHRQGNPSQAGRSRQHVRFPVPSVVTPCSGSRRCKDAAVARRLEQSWLIFAYCLAYARHRSRGWHFVAHQVSLFRSSWPPLSLASPQPPDPWDASGQAIGGMERLSRAIASAKLAITPLFSSPCFCLN